MYAVWVSHMEVLRHAYPVSIRGDTTVSSLSVYVAEGLVKIYDKTHLHICTYTIRELQDVFSPEIEVIVAPRCGMRFQALHGSSN